jgi:hypothetical protein
MQETQIEEIEFDEVKKRDWSQWFGTDAAVRLVYLVFGFFAILLLMILLQFSTKAVCCGDWDGYYHIRWSQLLWENFSSGKWLPEFKWLPLTVLNPADYADHHFLFHLLQVPFLWFFELEMAAKAGAVVFGSLAVFSCYWLLYRYGVDYMLVWLLALLTCANPFFYRMNMAKAPPLTIIYTVVGIYLLFERKYIWLLPLMFVFVWTYSLFPLLFIAAIIWAAIIYWNERKIEWQPVAYTGLGMILGNLINPYFPQNLFLFFEHFSTKFKSGDFAVAVGGEWYPYTGWELITHITIAMAAMIIGYILFAPKDGKLPERSTFFLVFSSILFVAMFRSKRYAEYFPPFAVLFAAFSWQAFSAAPTTALPEDFRRDIEPFLDAPKKTKSDEMWDMLKRLVPIWVGIILVGLLFWNFRGIDIERFGLKQEGLITSIKNNEANDKYQRAAAWMSENVPEDEVIFNASWDHFPKLFYYDQKHSYVAGLDPNYLFSKNQELWRLYEDITTGKHPDPGPIIREKFGSNYTFVQADENQDFVAKLIDSGWGETVYDDDEAIILKIRQQKGDAPPEAADEESGATDEEMKQAEEDESNTPADDEEVEEENTTAN